MDMREKVARAIEPDWWDEVDGKHPLDNYPYQHLNYQARALERATAAIEAMREPTEEMLEAGDDGYYGMSGGDVWEAMINTALKRESGD